MLLQLIFINTFSTLSLTLTTFMISYQTHMYIESILFMWKLLLEIYYKRLLSSYDLWLHHSLFIYSTYYTLFIKPQYLYLLSYSQIIHFPLLFYYLHKYTNDIRYLITYKTLWPITYFRDYQILSAYYYYQEILLIPIGLLLLLLDIYWAPKYNLGYLLN